MRQLPACSVVQLGVFTRAQALADGWTPAAIKHALRSGRITLVARGVYRAGPDEWLLPSHRRRRACVAAIVAALANPDGVVSHVSAAALQDLSVLHWPERPCITVRPGRAGRPRSAPVHLHRAAGTALVEQRHGVPCTSAARTVLDIAREHGVDDAVVAGDSALQDGKVSLRSLNRGLHDLRYWPGIRRAVLAVSLMNPSSESPLESMSRLVLGRLGLPTPRLQVPIHRRSGAFLGRTDFYWDEFGVVGEADGLEKYDDPRALREEKLRQERLEAAGLVVVRWGWSELRRADELTRRLGAAFQRGRERSGERGWFVGPGAAFRTSAQPRSRQT